MVNLLCLCGDDGVIEMPTAEEPSSTDEPLDDVDTLDPGDGSLYRHYRTRWTLYGDKLALVDHKTGESLTYAEFLENVTRVAGALSAMGVSARQRVALHVNNSIQSILAFLGVQFLNATAVACKTSVTVHTEALRLFLPDKIRNDEEFFYPKDLVLCEFVYQCAAADAQFIITDEACYTVALQALDQLPMIRKVVVANMNSPPNDLRIAATVEDLLKRGEYFEVPGDVNPNDDEILITFTSGTSGLPKGVLHTHAGIISQFAVTGPSGGNLVEPDDICLQWCPISHISGSMYLHCALNVGASNIVANVKQDLLNTIQICDTYGVTQFITMPVVLKAMIDLLKLYPGGCASLKKVYAGGSVINVSWSEEFLSLVNLESYRIS